jgi:SAM-dependent methyltransferase
VWDLIGAPLRMTVLPDDVNTRLGWTSKEQERLGAVLPHISGYLLDIGAGRNRLVQRYGNGIGVDVWDWGGGVQVVEDTAQLPFAADTFDTVSFVACLNHIPHREAVMQEAVRVLKPGGRVVVTMIPRWVGEISHRLAWYSEEKHRRVAEGEVFGMSPRSVIEVGEGAGLTLLLHRRFYYWLNHLFVFQKPVK